MGIARLDELVGDALWLDDDDVVGTCTDELEVVAPRLELEPTALEDVDGDWLEVVDILWLEELDVEAFWLDEEVVGTLTEEDEDEVGA